MSKFNCWEFKKCGRERGGVKAEEMGVCKASLESRTDGVHSGSNAGRACWVVAGTLCGGKVQGSFASKLINCIECEFYKSVMKEEGGSFKSSKEMLGLLAS